MLSGHSPDHLQQEGAHACESSLCLWIFLLRALLWSVVAVSSFSLLGICVPSPGNASCPLIPVQVAPEWLTQPGQWGSTGTSSGDSLPTVLLLGLPFTRTGEPGPGGVMWRRPAWVLGRHRQEQRHLMAKRGAASCSELPCACEFPQANKFPFCRSQLDWCSCH